MEAKTSPEMSSLPLKAISREFSRIRPDAAEILPDRWEFNGLNRCRNPAAFLSFRFPWQASCEVVE